MVLVRVRSHSRRPRRPYSRVEVLLRGIVLRPRRPSQHDWVTVCVQCVFERARTVKQNRPAYKAEWRSERRTTDSRVDLVRSGFIYPRVSSIKKYATRVHANGRRRGARFARGVTLSLRATRRSTRACLVTADDLWTPSRQGRAHAPRRVARKIRSQNGRRR